MGRLSEMYKAEGKEGIVSPSGGNAGLAAARAARLLGMKAHIHVSKKSYPYMIERLRREGAEVSVSEESSWERVYQEAKELADQLSYGFVSSFDHPKIWEGNATIVDEIVEEGVRPDAIVVSVGGGGLLAGVLLGLERHQMRDVAVVAVEPVGAPSFHAAMQVGHPLFVSPMETVATSLAVNQVAEEAVRLAKRHLVSSVLVTDQEAELACRRFLLDERTLVEAACGVALAPLYGLYPEVKRFKRIVVIICGGNLTH